MLRSLRKITITPLRRTPLSEQVVGGDFGLDVVAVGVVGEAVGRYHGYVDGLSCPCLFDETSSFVAENLVVRFCYGVFSGGELHLAEVDYAVVAV